ncbi:MAG TPA: ABC transporter substrate-binding protein [Solirubrobacteraceae bacterium]|jgi:putative hydroxymethylpyrimidine transport system substrate-binding protein|nr:ABC transporter substrate-binding protein [Solirubrobacteraceae bacterium]
MRLRRPAELAVIGLAAGSLVGCGSKQEVLTLPATPTRVVVGLSGPPGAVDAPLYTATTLGDFGRAGLAVTLQPATDGSQSLARLAAGGVDIAVSSEPDLLIARAKGEQLISIGALVQGPLQSLISIPPRPITKVGGLSGKTVATNGTSLAKAELSTMLRTAGVEATSVRTIAAPADLIAPLKNHTADASLGGQWNSDAVELGLQGHKPGVIRIENAGVPTFNQDILVVRQTEARNHGELLRTFLQALTQAVHTEQATPAAVAGDVPGLDQRFGTASLEATLPALDPPRKADPFGFQYPVAWRTFDTWMLTNGLLTVRSDAALAVDNEFLPGQGE